MPFSTTHIAFAEKALKDRLVPKYNEKEFIIGNVFPDIRYLGIIDRSTTHNSNINLASVIKEKDPFLAGISFHNLVDNAFKKYFETSLNTPGLSTYAIEFAFSKHNYNLIDNWNEICGYFDNILDQEKKYEIDERDLIKWHEIIKFDISTPPSLEKLKKVAELPLIPQGWYKMMLSDMDILEKNPQTAEKLEYLASNYQEILESY